MKNKLVKLLGGYTEKEYFEQDKMLRNVLFELVLADELYSAEKPIELKGKTKAVVIAYKNVYITGTFGNKGEENPGVQVFALGREPKVAFNQVFSGYGVAVNK